MKGGARLSSGLEDCGVVEGVKIWSPALSYVYIRQAQFRFIFQSRYGKSVFKSGEMSECKHLSTITSNQELRTPRVQAVSALVREL